MFGALLAAAWCAGGASIAAAADGAALFEAKCGACHSVGGGPKVGPDLKGVVARRGKDGAILAIVDPAKAGLGAEHAQSRIEPPEAEAISAYLDAKGIEGGAAAGKESAAPAAQEAAMQKRRRKKSVSGRICSRAASVSPTAARRAMPATT